MSDRCTSWRHLLVRLVRLCTLIGLTAGAWPANAQTQAPSQAPLQVLSQAQFRADAESAWSVVVLPHDWNRPAIPPPGQWQGHYRLLFTLPLGAPAQATDWAIRGTRLPSHHQVTLNGQVLEMRAAGGRNRAASRTLPTYIAVPPAMLRAGGNELLIDVHCDMRCGLAPLTLGPADAVLAQHLRYEALWVTTPQVINAAALSLAVFMVLIWWRRPQEEAVGVFGLLWVLEAVRNYAYLVTTTPFPLSAIEAVFFLINVELPLLLQLFARALSNAPSGWQRRALWQLVACAPALAAAGGLLNGVDDLRRFLYPLLLLLSCHALWLLWRNLRHVATPVFVVLWLSIGLSILASTHDLLYLRGHFSIEDSFWHPWLGPLMYVSFAGFLLGRIGRALGEAEDLNLRLEQRVEMRTAELRTANVAKTRFIASASHDLRQPLHALGLMVGLLDRRLVQPETRSVLARIEAAVNSMETLLNAILDVSRLDAGVEHPKVVAVSINGLMQQVERSFAAVAARRGLQLRLRPHHAWVASDPHMLQRILNNLVSNALRYTHHGGVLVNARNRSGAIFLEVWDTGIGIPANRLDDVFLEFIQLNNPERDREKGLGLGLAIVQRTAALLDHALEVRSTFGRGTVFRLRLPVVDVPQLPPSAIGEPLSDVSGLFVLVIDDELDILYAMQGLLSDWGCLVITARSGNEALAMLEQRLRQPEAMLLDYRLPAESGVTLAKRMFSAMCATPPTLIVTGDVTAGPLQDIEQSGLPVMHKPVNPVALRSWLGQVKDALAMATDRASGIDGQGQKTL